MKLVSFAIVLTTLGVPTIAGCRSLPVVNRYRYVEATVEDIPDFKKVEGIFVVKHYHPEIAEIMLVIGDQDKLEQIIGREIFSENVVSDCWWIKRIHRHYSEARRIDNFGRGSFNDSRVVFVTKKRAYMIPFGVDSKNGKHTVYGDDYVSEALGRDFADLGLIEEETPYKGIPGIEHLLKRKQPNQRE
jgi:hypothetical protein